MILDMAQPSEHTRLVPETYLSVDEAATRLKVGRQRIYDLIEAGRLRAAWREDTRTWQILEADVANFKPRRGGRPKKSTGQP